MRKLLRNCGIACALAIPVAAPLVMDVAPALAAHTCYFEPTRMYPAGSGWHASVIISCDVKIQALDWASEEFVGGTSLVHQFPWQWYNLGAHPTLNYELGTSYDCLWNGYGWYGHREHIIVSFVDGTQSGQYKTVDSPGLYDSCPLH